MSTSDDSEPYPQLPAAADPERACMRRIPFGEPEREGDRIVTRGSYQTQSALWAQRFNILVSADVHELPAVRRLAGNFRASFEAVPLDVPHRKMSGGAPEYDEVEQPAEEEPWDPGIDIDIELELEEPPPEGTEVLCGFIIDPEINSDTTPHRYKPANAQTFHVKMHVQAGRARVRVYDGSRDTRRKDEQSAVHDTRWLGADVGTPRAHVRGLADGSYYWLRGGWTQIV